LIYTLDPQYDRINIHHLSTVNVKGLEQAIATVLTFLWVNESAKEIRIGLHHYDEEKNGKMTKVVDPDIKNAMKKNKLKWKNILNVQNDRILMMGAVRDKTDKTTNELENILYIKSSLLYSVSNEMVRPQSATSNHSLFFLPGVCLSNLIASNINSEEENLPKHHQSLMEILWRIKEHNIESFPLTTWNKDEDVAKAIEPATCNEIPVDIERIKNSQKEYHWNTSKINSRIQSVDYCNHKIKSQNYRYLRIKTKEMIWVKAPHIDTKIFFMPVGAKNEFGMVVFQKPKNVLFSTPPELYEYCKDITNTMEEIDMSISSGLYLPCFKRTIQNEKLDFMHGFSVDQEEKTSITDTVFSSEISIQGMAPKKAALKFAPDDNSYVVDDDFIFMLTHPQLEEEAKIPFVW